jgi:hypothetical protein
MKDIYEQLPKLKVDLDLPRFLIIVITIFATFVLPAQFIQYYKTQSETQIATPQSGQVAGLATQKSSSTIKVPFTDTEVDLNSQAGVMIVGGMVLIGISIILIIFLLIDSYKSKL